MCSSSATALLTSPQARAASAFFTDSPGVEETGWQGNIIQTVSAFDWCLTMDVGISATGTGQDFAGLGPPFTPFVDVSFTGGNILLNGWFEGTMTTSDPSTWRVEGFLSPDGDFFAGFEALVAVSHVLPSDSIGPFHRST